MMIENLKINKNVGLTALRLYMENSNMEVGMVTVRHLIFSELIVQIRVAKDLSDAEEVWKLCFGNCHTIKEGKGKKVYESPLKDGYYTDEFGIVCIKISPRLADLIWEEAKVMEINEANVMAACVDLQIAGRMYQELTIDATKTMLKVEIPYGEDMIKVKLNSREREEDEYFLKCDWKFQNSTEEEKQQQLATELRNQVMTGKTSVKRFKNVIYAMNTDESKTVYEVRNNKKMFIRHVADFYNELRISLLTTGMEFADRMMNEEQQLSFDIRADIAASMKRPEMKEAYQLCMFCHDIFRTIQSYQTKSIMTANSTYPKKSAALEEHVKGIKLDTHVMVEALANQFRVEFKKLGLSEMDMVRVLLHTVLTDGNNASYAHTILEEEFFKFVMINMTNDEQTPQFSEDKLVFCDFEEGETVKFVAGKAVNNDKKAYATVPLCGDFIIRRNKYGKLVASKKIVDLIEIPDIKEDRLIFVTKPGGGKDAYTSSNLSTITKEMLKEGTKVTLVPYIKGKDVHDAIVINNTIVGSFRCSYGIAGKPISPKIVTNMYLYKEGVIDHIIVSDQGGGVGEIAVVTLKDVQTVPIPDIKENKIKPITTTVPVNMKHMFALFGIKTPEPAKQIAVPIKQTSASSVTKKLFGFDFKF